MENSTCLIKKVYETFGIPRNTMDGEISDYHSIRIGNVIKLLEDRKISRIRRKYGNTWTEDLLFLWRSPEKELNDSGNEIELHNLCQFILEIKEYEKHLFGDNNIKRILNN